MRIRYVIVLLLSLVVRFSVAQVCERRADLFASKPLKELVQATCEETKKSPECQGLYTEIEKNGEKVEDRALKCDDTGALPVATNADFFRGCALGGMAIATDAYKAVKNTVLSLRKEQAENDLCNKSVESRKALFTEYNASVPKMLQVSLPKDDFFQRNACTQIKALLALDKNRRTSAIMDQLQGRTSMEAAYSPQEQDFLNWIKNVNSGKAGGVNLLALAEEQLKKMNIKLQCYNRATATAMICEAAGAAALLAAGPVGWGLKAVRARNIAKMAGLAIDVEKVSQVANVVRVDEFVAAVNSANRAGAAAKLSNAAEKSQVLKLAENLTKEERMLALEKITGAKYSPEQADQLWKMHEVGSQEGRGYFTLTKEDLKEKLKLARDINPQTGKPYFSPEEADILMRNGLTGIAQADNKSRYAEYSAAAMKSENNFSQFHRLHAESAAAIGKIEEAKTAYAKAYTAYAKEKKINVGDSRNVEQRLSSLSERDLDAFEDLAAKAGRPEHLKAITTEKWKKIKADISKNSRLEHQSQDFNEDLRRVWNDLREEATSSRSNDIVKKAAEEKMNVMKALYPGLK